MRNVKDEVIHIKISKEEKEAAQKRAKEEMRNLSDYIRVLIRKDINKNN